MYKHQLCKESKYFRDLSHCPSNGTGWLAGIIRLPDLDSRIFRFFLYWLYNDVFTTYEDADLVSYPELIELYVLGEKLHVSVLKNVVIDCLASECLVQEKSIPTGFTRRIYHETPEKSPLRRLWVDLYAWKLERIDFEKEEAAGKVDNRFLRDLAKVQMRMIREEELFGRDAEPPFESDIQDYHEADPRDGRCCAREEFEGDERMHRVGSAFESALLKIKLARAEEEMRELRRQLLEALEPPKRRKLIDGLRPA